MKLDDIHQKIESLAKKIVEAQGMDLIELKVTGQIRDVHIRVIADKPSGGINIRECVILNKSLVAAIEQEKFLPREMFSLEVSSPGIDKHR